MENGITLGFRILYFLASLGLLGTFFLPWLRLDGFEGTDSAITLMALVASPWAEYFYSVDQISAVMLMGVPIAMLVFACGMVSKYARGRSSPFATCMALVLALALVWGTKDLTASGPNPYFGLQLAIAILCFLSLHQLAMLIQARLFKMKKFPRTYRFLSIATGRRPWRMGREA